MGNTFRLKIKEGQENDGMNASCLRGENILLCTLAFEEGRDRALYFLYRYLLYLIVKCTKAAFFSSSSQAIDN